MADSSWQARQLTPCRFVICASPGYLEQAGTPQQPLDLYQHPCFGRHLPGQPQHWQLYGPDGVAQTIQINSRLRANSDLALRAATLHAAGIALLPSYCVGTELAQGLLCSLLPHYQPQPSALHIVYPHNPHLAPKVRVLIDFLVARFTPEPYWDVPAAA